MNKYFKGRKLAIASKHQKEKAMAPLLENELGVACFVPENLDTDLLGTFTGEVSRVDDVLDTARKKCLLAMELSGCDLAISSEGSFGPHPTHIFSYSDDEIMLLLDKKNNIEIMARFITTETNFNAMEILSKEQLISFAKSVQFPSHALILKSSKDNFDHMKKGISDWDTLNTHFNFLIRTFQRAYIETDMRALFNPTRMQFLEKVCQKLIDKIKLCCPVCYIPGFGISSVKDGLPCSQCQRPTASALSYEYSCLKCYYTKEEKYPNKKEFEEPMFCNFCNP